MDFYYRKSVDLDHGNLNYTMVIGEMLGNYAAEEKGK
jgi:hypothetical protein